MAVWTAAQDGATKSKQGLGRSGQPRTVAGARWQGTRTKLGSDDDASDGASDADDDATCVTVHRRRLDPTVMTALAVWPMNKFERLTDWRVKLHRPCPFLLLHLSAHENRI